MVVVVSPAIGPTMLCHLPFQLNLVRALELRCRQAPWLRGPMTSETNCQCYGEVAGREHHKTARVTPEKTALVTKLTATNYLK